MRYTTVAELKAAYERGELDRNNPVELNTNSENPEVYPRDADGRPYPIWEQPPLFALDAQEALAQALELLGIPVRR